MAESFVNRRAVLDFASEGRLKLEGPSASSLPLARHYAISSLLAGGPPPLPLGSFSAQPSQISAGLPTEAHRAKVGGPE